jgi:hypothetical protein
MAINAAWHKANRMPKNATLDQRVAWHEAHLRECGCRKDLPPAVAAEIARLARLDPRRGRDATP